MCRINGIIQTNVDINVLELMRDSLIYGGPDDAGIFVNESKNIGLAQRRLSIIDLSEGGHQPMKYKDYVIVFNGEIYNYNDIAKELIGLGYKFDSGSDTEVILKAFHCWGYDSVHKFRGMFTFALWNESTKKLLLCRDRVGVKPLYWYQKEGLFLFASELKAFHKHPDFDKTINQDAVSLFLQTGYIRSPFSIFKYAHKLEPGSFLEIDENNNIKKWKYWDVREQYLNAELSDESEDVLIEKCETILTESFKLRMVADVPVGMFLSGGIDSSLVTALLQKEYSTPLNTFTIGFEDPKFNEAKYAKEIAKHIGTNHTELYCNEKHFEEIIDSLPEYYDEPFGDSSAIPTYLVSKLARKAVTVSLSADGGDEIFTGYNRYLFSDKLFDKVQHIPKPLREIGSKLVSTFSTKFVENIIQYLPISESYKKNIDARLPKIVEALKANTPLDFLYASTLFISEENLKKAHDFTSIEQIFDKNLLIRNQMKNSAYGVADIESYLEGDILAKVDRATMQVALEGREPFLDHKIIEFALTLPDNMKLRNGETKWILRQILYKYVPKQILDRPKMGFGIPLNDWLSTILKQDLLEISMNQNFLNCFKLNPEYIQNNINNYLKGKGDSPFFVWYLFCLYKWYQKWM
jgi:asparagine synthase (glutamine-hydrolysing)